MSFNKTIGVDAKVCQWDLTAWLCYPEIEDREIM